MRNILILILLFQSLLIYAQWSDTGNIINYTPESSVDNSSVDLSADGRTIILGDRYADIGYDNNGAVRVFRKNESGNWNQLGETILGTESLQNLGFSVSINASGNIIAIGSPYISSSDYSEDNRVVVYEYINDSWVQIGDELGLETSQNNKFGYSVSLNAEGNVLAVGARNSGQVKVYYRLYNNWVQWGQTIERGHYFGESVKLNGAGNRVIISENREAVYVYEIQQGEWSLVGQKIEFFTNSYARTSVSINYTGDIIAMGFPAPYNTSISTAKKTNVLSYKLQNNNWEMRGDTIQPAGNIPGSGPAIDIDSTGNNIVVGTGNYGGHIYAYHFDSENWINLGTEIDGFYSGDNLGQSVAISNSGNKVTGGYEESSNFIRVFEYSCADYNLDIGADTSICNNDSILLASNITGDYLWNTNETGSNIVAKDSGCYILEASLFECESIDSINIAYKQSPVYLLPDDTVFCENDTISLNAGNDVSYNWSTGDTTNTIQVITPGEYSVTVVSNNNCSLNKTISVDYSTPVSGINQYYYRCGNEDILVTANEENDYNWSTGDSENEINIGTDVNSPVLVTVTDLHDCSRVDTVNFINQAFDFNYTIEGNLVLFNVISDFDMNYIWNFGDGSMGNSANVSHQYLNTGLYEVCLYSFGECADTVCKTIDVLCSDTLNDLLPEEFYSVYPGQDFSLEIDDVFDSYLWSTGDTTNSIFISYDSLSLITDSNQITLMVNYNNTCFFEKSFKIKKYECQNFDVYIDSSCYNPSLNNVIVCSGISHYLVSSSDILIYDQEDANYPQEESDLTYYWKNSNDSIIHIGDSLKLQNSNLEFISFMAYDLYGCESNISNIQILTSNLVNNINYSQDTILLGDTVFFNTDIETLHLEEAYSNIDTIGIGFSDEVVTVSSLINIQNATDTINVDSFKVCVNIEHSYLMDLAFELKNPMGEIVKIHDSRQGGEENLGIPNYENDSLPGTGYEYCWIEESESGVLEEALLGDTMINPGTYTSFESFSGLSGNDLNGVWELIITDIFVDDNGYLFSWSISNGTKIYEPQVIWQGEGIDNSDTLNTFAVPSTPGLHTYSASVNNQYGYFCDSTILIYVDDLTYLNKVVDDFVIVRPNPAKEKINIDIKNGQRFNYKLINLSGIIVKSRNKFDNYSEIELTNLSGIHILQLTLEEGKTISKKIIVVE